MCACRLHAPDNVGQRLGQLFSRVEGLSSRNFIERKPNVAREATCFVGYGCVVTGPQRWASGLGFLARLLQGLNACTVSLAVAVPAAKVVVAPIDRVRLVVQRLLVFDEAIGKVTSFVACHDDSLCCQLAKVARVVGVAREQVIVLHVSGEKCIGGARFCVGAEVVQIQPMQLPARNEAVLEDDHKVLQLVVAIFLVGSVYVLIHKVPPRRYPIHPDSGKVGCVRQDMVQARREGPWRSWNTVLQRLGGER